MTPIPGYAAVTIGVSQFDPIPAEAGLTALDFAPELVTKLATALRGIGYQTTEVAVPSMDSATVGSTIAQAIEAPGADGIVVVHVISHGQQAAGAATAYVLGSDGQPHEKTDIGQWLVNLQNLPNRPRTLFLLDLCFSGTVARLPWQTAVDARTAKGWVIAACQPGQVAWDGRFTEAVTNVLAALSKGELDIDPAMTHVPLPTVARAIHQEVNRLIAVHDSAPQQVTASLIDMSVDPDLPFFPNPAHTTDPRAQLRNDLDPELVPFLDDLDEGLDAHHFLERAAGVSRLLETTGALVGCFSGRKKELLALSAWLDREGHDNDSLCVVTGSPGAGKSALLGVCVCAAHPRLREPTRPLWDEVARAPYRNLDLVAVHARRRSLDMIVTSIGRQLGTDCAAPAELLAVVRKRDTRPVIVLDALDEAENSEAVTNELLLPLINARRDNGRSAVRLAVGVRDYREYEPVLSAARERGLFVNLDEVPPDVLEDDLHTYVNQLLRAVPAFRRMGGVTGAFATEVAHVLAKPETERADGPRWGPFLVAGLYTRHLVNLHPDGTTLRTSDAIALGENVPRDLPAVLELDLAGRSEQPWLRPVLTAIAHAKGNGMPITVVSRLAAIYQPDPTPADIRNALNEAKFYLRQATDTDHTTAYRLFHQGLVDYLVQHPRNPHTDRHVTDFNQIVTALLAPLGPEDARVWEAAEPYVFRHVIDHASDIGPARAATDHILGDPGFLLNPQSAAALARLDPDHRLESAIQSALADRTDPVAARAALALASARTGQRQLAQRAANLRLPSPMSWQPQWTVGELALVEHAVSTPDTVSDSGLMRVGHFHDGVRSLVLSANGRAFAACSSTARIQAWNAITADSRFRSEDRVATASALALSPDGRILAYGDRFGNVRFVDLDSAGLSVKPKLHSTKVGAIAVRASRDTVSASVDGTVQLTGQRRRTAPMRTGIKAEAWAAAFPTAGPRLVVGDKTGAVFLLEPAAVDAQTALCQHDSAVVCVGISVSGQYVASASVDGVIRLSSNGWERQLTLKRAQPPSALAVSDDGLLLVVGAAIGAQLLDLHLDRVVAALDPPRTPFVAAAVDAKGLVAMLADDEGFLYRWWPQGPLEADRPQPTEPASALAPATPRVSSVAIAPAGLLARRAALVGDSAGAVTVVGLDDDARLGPARELSVAITDVDFPTVAGRALVHLAGADGTALLWDPATDADIAASGWPGLRTRAQIEASRRTIFLNGRLVEVRANQTGVIELSELDEQGRVESLPCGHGSQVTAIACGLLLGRPTAYTGDSAGTVHVWDLLDGRCADTIRVTGAVQSLSPTDDGNLIITAGGEAVCYRHISAVQGGTG